MRREHGVALITALLIVAIATAMAVSMGARQQLDMRRNANRLLLDQSWHYALGVEAWAARVLTQDRKDNAHDHPLEEWAVGLPPLPIEGGSIVGRVESMQGRFNLNNLFAGGKLDELQRQRFERLLEVLELDPGLSAALLDWMDGDPDVRPGGAEEVDYLSMQPPYRSADRQLSDPSELRLIMGFNAEVVNTLLPYVSTLPPGSAISVNHAEPQVLMALVEGLAESDAEMLIAERGDEGFSRLEDFLKHDALAGLELDERGLDIATNYFKVSAEIALGRNQLRFAVLLQRDEQGNCRPLWRRMGE